MGIDAASKVSGGQGATVVITHRVREGRQHSAPYCAWLRHYCVNGAAQWAQLILALDLSHE